jgi:hypothetical protein
MLLSQISLAQAAYSVLDQNPFSVKHRRISLNRYPVKIIYPEGLDSVAQVTANQLERNLGQIGQGMNASLHSWKIVLQNQGMLSNGFVSLAAPRSEYFTTPTQDPSLLGNNDWLELLAAHESRHMFQNELGRTGLSKWLHYFWGANGQMAYTNLMIPHWVWEGDAITTESRIQGAGRSDIPQFKMPLRAYVDYFGVPKYAKVMGRSYREFVPNHYVFGQYFVQKLQQTYGQAVIGEIWQKSLNTPGPFSFSRAVKQKSGYSIDNFARNSLQQLAPIENDKKRRKQVGFTNYLYPIPVSDTSYVALMSGFDANMQLILHTPSGEKRLAYIGPYYDNSMLSASDKFVIWSEYQYHPRWGQRNQTSFFLYDFEKQKRIKWKSVGQATNPSISSDSKYIGAIVYEKSGATSLRVFDRETGENIAQLVGQPGEQFMQPRLQSDADFVFISKVAKNKTIRIWNWKSNKIRESIELGTINASHPYLVGTEILMNMPVNGVDQVVAVDLSTKKLLQKSSEKYGAYHGIKQGANLIYNQYTATGYQVVSSDTFSNDPVPLAGFSVPKADSLVTYPVDTYSKWNLINPYAWGGLVTSEGNSLDIGLISRDVLNNLQASAGYQWSANEQVGKRFARFSYQGFFPIIDFNYEAGMRSTTLNLPISANQFALTTDQWNQTKYSIGLRIPFNLTHSVFQESLEVRTKLDLLQVSGYDLQRRYISEAFNGTYSSMNYLINYSKLFNRTYRDLQSKWGFQFVGRYTATPFKQSLQAEMWTLQTKFFLPGFMKHHGFGVRLGYQQESKGNYRFSSNLVFPRGFTYASYDRMFSYSVDYRFPLASTDFNLGRIVYLKRLNMDIFADGGRGQVKQKSQVLTRDYQSIGVDLSFQVHLMRFSQEFELGVRGVYLPQTKELAWFPLVLDIGF